MSFPLRNPRTPPDAGDPHADTERSAGLHAAIVIAVLMATPGFLPEIGGVEGIERLSQPLTRLGFRVTVHPVGRRSSTSRTTRSSLRWRGHPTRNARSILFGEHVGAIPDDNPILGT